jgi:hypothetical protein
MNKPTFHGCLPLEVVAVDQDECISLKSQSLFAFTQALESVPHGQIECELANVVGVAGEKFRSLALLDPVNRLKSPSCPLCPRLDRPLISCLQQVRYAFRVPGTARPRIHAALSQRMPDLPQGQSLLLVLSHIGVVESFGVCQPWNC